MSDLNELFAELKAEIAERTKGRSSLGYYSPLEDAEYALYELDALINNGEFARAEQDAYIG